MTDNTHFVGFHFGGDIVWHKIKGDAEKHDDWCQDKCQHLDHLAAFATLCDRVLSVPPWEQRVVFFVAILCEVHGDP